MKIKSSEKIKKIVFSIIAKAAAAAAGIPERKWNCCAECNERFFGKCGNPGELREFMICSVPISCLQEAP